MFNRSKFSEALAFTGFVLLLLSIVALLALLFTWLTANAPLYVVLVVGSIVLLLGAFVFAYILS